LSKATHKNSSEEEGRDAFRGTQAKLGMETSWGETFALSKEAIGGGASEGKKKQLAKSHQVYILRALRQFPNRLAFKKRLGNKTQEKNVALLGKEHVYCKGILSLKRGKEISKTKKGVRRRRGEKDSKILFNVAMSHWKSNKSSKAASH